MKTIIFLLSLVLGAGLGLYAPVLAGNSQPALTEFTGLSIMLMGIGTYGIVQNTSSQLLKAAVALGFLTGAAIFAYGYAQLVSWV